MIYFFYVKEILTNEGGFEYYHDAYINAFEVMQFAPINENDTSRGVIVNFKNGEERRYKCDLIDFIKFMNNARIAHYSSLISYSNIVSELKQNKQRGRKKDESN
jgi:hypothetical protein